MPENSNGMEGRRHVSTVPVKLCRAQNTAHRQHVDAPFATASLRYIESLASFLGPSQVFFVSQDAHWLDRSK